MGDYYKEMLSQQGFANECIEIDRTYKDPATRSKAGDLVPRTMIDKLMIQGDAAHCRSELARHREAGLSLPILNLPSGMPWPVLEAFIKTMAPQG